MEKTQHESSEDSKRAYAGMYVPKEVTESSSSKDSDNTPPRDNINVITGNVKKSSTEVIPQRRSLKGIVWLADISLEKPNLDSIIDDWVIQQSKALTEYNNEKLDSMHKCGVKSWTPYPLLRIPVFPEMDLRVF